MSESETNESRQDSKTANHRRAHTPIADRVDVAIVGSGLGGLVSAALLAKAGLRVAVFESHYTTGGCATQFSRGPRAGRYHFDVGVHYVGDCAKGGSIPRILDAVGVDVAFEPMDPDGFDTLVFPDFKFRIPASLDLYRARLVEMFPRERRGIERYVSLVDAVMRLSRAMERRDERPALSSVPGLLRAGVRVAPFQKATISQVLDTLVRDVRLKAVLLGQSGDYGLPPSEVSALLHLGLAGHYFRGAYYPRGGGQVIADRLAARIEQLGGTVHLRTPVERVLVQAGRAVGLRLAPKAGDPPREVRASVVLSNADIIRTLRELVGPEHLPDAWVARTGNFKMAAALFMTFLGVQGDLRELGMQRTNYWQFDDYDVEAFYRPRAGSIASSGCYITSASLKDPDSDGVHAPPGISNLEVMTVVPGGLDRWGVAQGEIAGWDYKKTEVYQRQKASLEDQMIARFERLFPGGSARIVFRESATPISHRRYTGAEGGTGYGLAATPAQFMANRPGYRGPLDRLYLCGASTRAGHGIVGAMMSGEQAARRILRDLLPRS